MILFTKSLLLITMHNCRDLLMKIAQNLAAGNICDENEFINAVAREDSDKVNFWLEQAIISYTGKENTVYGLKLYCEKFNISVPPGILDEKALLLLINENSDNIEPQLSMCKR